MPRLKIRRSGSCVIVRDRSSSARPARPAAQRSLASLLPISMPSGGRLLLPSERAPLISAITDSLSCITPITPTGATAWPRSTKADPLICGDIAVTPDVFSMIGIAGCQIAI